MRCLGLAVVISALLATGVIAEESSKLDVIIRKNKTRIEGVILSEDDQQIRFLAVMRRKHKRTLTMEINIARSEVARVERLSVALRAQRLAEIREIKSQQVSEAKAIRTIKLKDVPWLGGRGRGNKFTSKRFELYSNAQADFTRRMAYKLEQIFAAYERHFAVSRNRSGKVRIYVFNTSAEYYGVIGRQIQNPAVYVASRNLVLAGTDLAKMREQVILVRRKHTALKVKIAAETRSLNRRKTEVERKKEQYRKEAEASVRAGKATRQEALDFWSRVKKWEAEQKKAIYKHKKYLTSLKSRSGQIDRQNEHLVRQYAGSLIRMLYHEAFHAFLNNFLFTKEQVNTVPAWINEGMAQFFENSFIEGTTLRIGTMDKQRVAKLRSFIRSGSVVPLRNLLAAGSEKFIVSNALDLEQSNVHYLQSWAVVYYLSMRRGAKGGNLFGPYVSRLARGEDPARAFGVLSGQTLEQVDRAWRELFSR